MLPSQVNIDDRAKHEALLYTEQHDYISLSLVREGGVREEAEANTERQTGRENNQSRYGPVHVCSAHGLVAH